MARLCHDSSSDDEFPALQVVAKRARQRKLTATQLELNTADKENTTPRSTTVKGKQPGKTNVPTSLSEGTPLRRRKLGVAQVLDNPLFRKWSEDATESRSRSARSSRASSREIKQKTPEISESVLQEGEDSIEESDDDVFVRKRKPAHPAVQKSRPQRVEGRIKTEALVSVIQLEDDAKTIEETLEISAILSEGERHTSSDEESEFVTALSEGVESEPNYESPSEFDFVPKSQRSKSPNSQRLKPVQIPPPKDILRKEIEARKTPAMQKEKNGNADGDSSAPQTPPRVRSRKAPAKTSTLEEDFNKLKLYADDLDASPETKPQPQLFPVTPRKTLQNSPFRAPHIPPSPWKVDHKEFWDVETQNEWIDRHSPPKRSPKKLDLMAGPDKKEALKKRYGTSPEKRDAKKAFDQAKERLAQDFLEELDKRITSCQLAELTAESGGLRIKWSTSLQTTAGRAHWKCKEVTTKVQQPDGSYRSTRERKHEAWIELAAKVLTKEDDLMNTVAHEFCHLAVFMLNGKPKFAHGAEFKSWGQKCMDEFSSRGIEVTTKHNYEIDFKFIWRCADCTCEVKRHSKSVDPIKQKCGRCHGQLEQVKPTPRAGAKGRSAYQEFVSQEMKVLKAEGKGLSFKEMMATVSARWKAHQQANQTGKTADQGVKGLEEQLQGLAVTDLISD